MKDKSQLFSEFREQVVPKIESVFTEVISKSNTEFNSVFKSSLELFSKEKHQEAFETLQAFAETIHNESTSEFPNAMDALVETLTTELTLPQEEAHYVSDDEDSVTVKAGKVAKRFSRGVYRASLKSSNSIRSVFKKPALPETIRTRNVPYRAIVKAAMLDQSDLLTDWQRTRYAMFFYTVDQLQSLLLNYLIGKKKDEQPSQILEAQQILLKELDANLQRTLNNRLSELERSVLATLEQVGTIERPVKEFEDEQVGKKTQRFNSNWAKNAFIWGELIVAKSDQLTTGRILQSLRAEVISLGDSLLNHQHSFLEEHVEIHRKQLVDNLRGYLDQLKELDESEQQALVGLSESIQAETKNIVEEKMCAPLNKALEEQIFSQKLNEFAGSVTNVADEQQDKLTLIKNLEFEDNLPEYTFKEIEWQTFVRRLLGDYLASEMLPEELKVEHELSELSEDCSEVAQIITTNLKAAAEIDKKDEEKPIDIIINGIDLALLKLEEIETIEAKFEQHTAKVFLEQKEGLFKKIHELLKNQDVGEMKWADTQMRVRESADDYGEKLSIYWAKFVGKLEVLQRFLTHRFKEINESVRTFFGLAEAEHINVQKTNIATILHETDLKFKELPFIYRRLFDFKREVDSGFFVKNSEFFDRTQKSLDLWDTGFPSSVAIVGEKGSGRSTLLRFLDNEVFTNQKVELVDISRTVYTEEALVSLMCKQLKVSEQKTARDLVAILHKRRKKTVILVENIQNSFVRNINGYGAINALLYIITETKKDAFWVVTCSRYAWGFLDVVNKISDYFSHTLQVDTHSEPDLEQLIMCRQKASGYQVEFKPDPTTAKSRSYKKLLDDYEESQLYLKERFFERLNKMAEGNATVAMIFWIRSIQDFEDSYFTIQPVDFSGIEYLADLDSNSLFVLSAFVVHDVLNAEELSLIIKMPKTASEMIISRLFARGLLVANGQNFSLNDMIYRQVVRLLKSRNILNS